MEWRVGIADGDRIDRCESYAAMKLKSMHCVKEHITSSDDTSTYREMIAEVLMYIFLN